MPHLFKQLFQLACGESDDVVGEIEQRFSRQGPVSRDDYFQRTFAKKAAMFVLSTCAAAMLRNGGVQAIGEYSRAVGMAFQTDERVRQGVEHLVGHVDDNG